MGLVVRELDCARRTAYRHAHGATLRSLRYLEGLHATWGENKQPGQLTPAGELTDQIEIMASQYLNDSTHIRLLPRTKESISMTKPHQRRSQWPQG